MNKRIEPEDCLSSSLFLCLPKVIFGAEEEEQQEQQEKKPESKTEDKSKEKEEEQEEEEDDDKEDVTGLKSALEKERKERKALEKQAKALLKEKEEKELAEKSQVEQAQTKEKNATEKVSKLAAGLLTRDLNAAITKAAEKFKFVDTQDAIDLIDRGELEYEQDDDDPSNITIDLKSVERAVKALATKKPHFISSGTEDGKQTGSTFGGSQKQKQTTPEEDFKKQYPSLR